MKIVKSIKMIISTVAVLLSINGIAVEHVVETTNVHGDRLFFGTFQTSLYFVEIWKI